MTNMPVYRRMERDRPTKNSLVYITKVEGHTIQKDPQIVDPFVRRALIALLDKDPVEEFSEFTRSFYTEEGHYLNLWKYDRKITPRPGDPDIDLALELTRKAFAPTEPILSIGWDSLGEVPYIPTSSAGWKYKGPKGAPGNHELAISRAVGSLYAWLDSQRPDRDNYPRFRYTPDLAFTRTQLMTMDSPKIRHVWGKAFHNIILEGMSASPLIHYYSRIGQPIVVGVHLYKKLPYLIRTCLWDGEHRRIGVGLDMTSFDTCPMPWLINAIFDMIESYLTFPDEMSHHAFRYTRKFFIDTPVIMPDGRMWLKKLGVPSGSYYTQLVDSMINYTVIMYLQTKMYNQQFTTWVLGDDSLFGIPDELGFPDLDEAARIVKRIGFELSTRKCIVATHPGSLEFLGHVSRGASVDREWSKMILLALFPEREVTDPGQSLARVFGLLVDSALNNTPLITLAHAMEALYSYPEMTSLAREDSNWLRAVVGVEKIPPHVDLVKVWTLT
ncbi:RNA-dependent RNA polymerase [Jilin partiti-like virus 1]|nr:RNA-dependent RNA polymerase [Jilin partiti-like virus 1]UXX19068.1 RNA-dependent RNA polymerase [Jilin partiti-like virus 1]UXX19071.1 RNA-dependent RNA polymerase [Jilin partiti-like virus 1]WAK75593.1 MAG: RNA-dependent RNA polymerase [Norway partiti-like virus 1]WNK16406.1 MAG: RNA-dependent RNA polymerase [Jilin partiti-like virus 1]